jgi:phytoene dehydrogenase-like protein
MTPPKFEERFRAPDGNVYHVDPTAMRFGPLRPGLGFAGYKAPLDGLFLSGGGMHPSAGICGVPGKLAAAAAMKALAGTAPTGAGPRPAPDGHAASANGSAPADQALSVTKS